MDLRNVVERFVEAFNVDDLDAVMGVFDPNAEYVTVFGKRRRGLAEIRREFEPQFRGDFGVLRFHVETMAVDEVLGTAAVTWTCEHRFDAPSRGARGQLIQSALRGLFGAAAAWQGVDVFRFTDDGKILSKQTYAHGLMGVRRTLNPR